MSNILFLYNRKSGRQKSQELIEAVCSTFNEAGKSVIPKIIDFERNPFDGVLDIEHIVVAGGDGTVGYVAGQMLRNGISLPMSIIPAGTANDFATMLGIPHNPRNAALHALRSPIRKVDCGVVNGEYFVNIFSFGTLTTTSQHTPNKMKRRFGRLAYFFEGLREFINLRPLPLCVKSDSEEFSADVIMALVFNGCTAGRFPLARTSRPDDGLFDALFLVGNSRLRFVWDAVRYLCGATPDSVRHIQSRRLHITSALTDINTDIDGEAGPSLPLDIELLHHALQIKG